MNKVWIICLMLLCFGSVMLLGTVHAGDSKAKVEKVEKKPAKTIKATTPAKMERSSKRPDRFIDKNNNGVNDQKKPKVVKPKVDKPKAEKHKAVKHRAVSRTKAASIAEPKPKKEKAPPR